MRCRYAAPRPDGCGSASALANAGLRSGGIGPPCAEAWCIEPPCIARYIEARRYKDYRFSQAGYRGRGSGTPCRRDAEIPLQGICIWGLAVSMDSGRVAELGLKPPGKWGRQVTVMGCHERALQGMKPQRAIRWISDQLQDDPTANRGTLIDTASRQFGLGPRQEELLHHMYMQTA